MADKDVEFLVFSDADVREHDHELLDMDWGADANANLPPLEKGTYVVIPRFETSDLNKRWVRTVSPRDGETYYKTTVLLEVANNPINPPASVGRVIYAYVSTAINKAKKTSTCMGLIQGMVPREALANQPRTAKAQAVMLNNLISSGKLAGVSVDWEARDYDKLTDTVLYGPIRGMENFPKLEGGSGYQAFVVNPDTKKQVDARNVVKKFMLPADVGEARGSSFDPTATTEASGAVVVDEGAVLEGLEGAAPAVAAAALAAPAAVPVPAGAPVAPAASSAPSGAQTGRRPPVRRVE